MHQLRAGAFISRFVLGVAALTGCSRSELPSQLNSAVGDASAPPATVSMPPVPMTAPPPEPPVPTPSSPVTTPVPGVPPQPDRECDYPNDGPCWDDVAGYCDSEVWVICERDASGCPQETREERAEACAEPACAEGEQLCADGRCSVQCFASCDGAQLELGQNLGAPVVEGDTTGQLSTFSASCGSGSRSPDQSHAWTAPADGCFQFDTLGSSFDTVLHVLACAEGAELACSDDVGSFVGSGFALDLAQGTAVLLVVDGYADDSFGEYVLNVRDCGESCGDGVDNDADEFTDCEDPECAGTAPCLPEDCSSGGDEDGDGAVDCADADCVADPGCVEDCTDGADNDGDGQVDCADAYCQAQDSCLVCPDPQADLADALGAVASGTTRGETFKAEGSCGGTYARDYVLSWRAPADGCYRLDTDGSDFDTVLHVHEACPEFDEIACNDDFETTASRVSFTASEDTQYSIVVDGYSDQAEGNFVLNIEDCVEDCSNYYDDDLDGSSDCEDQDCAASPSCTVEDCDNGLDDNANGAFDCDDDSCATDPACFECPNIEQDLQSSLGLAVYTGSTDNAASSVRAAGCAGDGPEHMFTWTAPESGCYEFDTDGSEFDTVLHLRTLCPSFDQLYCDDDSGSGTSSLIRADLEAGNTIQIVVDGFEQGESGNYTLSIGVCD